MSRLQKSFQIWSCLLETSISTTHKLSKGVNNAALCRNNQLSQSKQRHKTPLCPEPQPSTKNRTLHAMRILNPKAISKSIEFATRVQTEISQGLYCTNGKSQGSHQTVSVRGALIYTKQRIETSKVGLSYPMQAVTLTIISERCTSETKVWDQVASLLR